MKTEARERIFAESKHRLRAWPDVEYANAAFECVATHPDYPDVRGVCYALFKTVGMTDAQKQAFMDANFPHMHMHGECREPEALTGLAMFDRSRNNLCNAIDALNGEVPA